MFLKLFRKRSNQKYINKILNSKRSKFSDRKIRSVGIILSLEEYKDYDKLKGIFSFTPLSKDPSPKSSADTSVFE